MIEETQRNVDQMRVRMNCDSNSYSQASSGYARDLNPHGKPAFNPLIDEAPKSYRSSAREGFEEDFSVSKRSVGLVGGDLG